jgi:DNA recombination protein RmuC
MDMQFIIIFFSAMITAALVFIIVKLRKPAGGEGTGTIDALNARIAELNDKVIRSEEKDKNLSETIGKQNSQILEKDSIILDLNRRLSQKETEFSGLQAKLQEQKEEIGKIQEKFTKDFEILSNKILEDQSKRFTEQNRTKLDELLKPLGEKLTEFKTKVEETYDKESKQRFSLEKEIRTLAELNQKISQDATNLTEALRSDSKKQGNWGELVLERVLESSGLVKDLEYLREFSTRDNQGEVYRPDVIIKLPDDKHIIIDSKVSLNAYTDFVNATDPAEKEKYIKLHLISIRNHVKLLSEKNYQNLDVLDTPDYVLLFLPIESSFSAALQADTDLFNFAWEKNVVIVSPTTLLATLRTIASIWKHEKQTRNAIEIARQGGLLYDKFVSFLQDLERIGNQIDTVKKTYDEAHKKLKSGTGNLIGKVEKLKELGAKTSKELPKKLLNSPEEQDDN